jgi:uncharacterized protein YigA (DUF484 family)
VITPAGTTSSMGIQGITESDIANYLANSPGFFERHAELLGSVQLTSPHGQRAVSLQERQMEMLRDKIRGLEQRLIEMMRHGQDNMAVADKLHGWTQQLMLTANAADLANVLMRDLLERFMIPQGALRVWGAADAFSALSFARPVSDDAQSFASSLSVPYCGANVGFEAVGWLDDPGSARSIAMIPMRDATSPIAFGLLVLASPDPTRYTADMGTEFLQRIGEIASAALSRLLPAG